MPTICQKTIKVLRMIQTRAGFWLLLFVQNARVMLMLLIKYASEEF